MKSLVIRCVWMLASVLFLVAYPLLAENERPAKIKAAAIQVVMVQSDEIKLPAEFQVALYENLVRQLEKKGFTCVSRWRPQRRECYRFGCPSQRSSRLQSGERADTAGDHVCRSYVHHCSLQLHDPRWPGAS